MKSSRIGLVILGTLLMLVPLLTLFTLQLKKTLEEASRGQEDRILPMLSRVEREGTLTYGRECRSDSDCDPRLRCFFSMVLQSSYCVDSRCMTDTHCPKGFSCQTYIARNQKDLLKTCSLVGSRAEGEECEALTVEPDSGCERGLVCQGWCGRRCTPGDPTPCPTGFFCHESREGSACQPTCDERACPEGQRCIDVGGKRSVCAKVHGTDCQTVACGPGQDCSARTYPWAPGEVWMHCTQTCGQADTPPCPEGMACAFQSCRPACSPDGGKPCAERFECTSHPNRPSVCAPDVADHHPLE